MAFDNVYICPVCSSIEVQMSVCRGCLSDLVELTPEFQDNKQNSVAVQSAARIAQGS